MLKSVHKKYKNIFLEHFLLFLNYNKMKKLLHALFYPKIFLQNIFFKISHNLCVSKIFIYFQEVENKMPIFLRFLRIVCKCLFTMWEISKSKKFWDLKFVTWKSKFFLLPKIFDKTYVLKISVMYWYLSGRNLRNIMQ